MSKLKELKKKIIIASVGTSLVINPFMKKDIFAENIFNLENRKDYVITKEEKSQSSEENENEMLVKALYYNLSRTAIIKEIKSAEMEEAKKIKKLSKKQKKNNEIKIEKVKMKILEKQINNDSSPRFEGLFQLYSKKIKSKFVINAGIIDLFREEENKNKEIGKNENKIGVLVGTYCPNFENKKLKEKIKELSYNCTLENFLNLSGRTGLVIFDLKSRQESINYEKLLEKFNILKISLVKKEIFIVTYDRAMIIFLPIEDGKDYVTLNILKIKTYSSKDIKNDRDRNKINYKIYPTYKKIDNEYLVKMLVEIRENKKITVGKIEFWMDERGFNENKKINGIIYPFKNIFFEFIINDKEEINKFHLI